MILPILDQVLIALPLLIGAYITISLLKLPDFSIESAYLFGAVMAYLTNGLPLPLVLLSAAFGGIIVGTIVSTLNQYFKLPFLLAAIITNGLFHGLTQYLLGTSLQSFHLKLFLPEPFFFAAIGVGLMGVMGFALRSQLGYSFAAYGNNPLFFERHCISSSYVAYSGILAGHACAGIGGFLFALSNGFIDLTMNFGVILLCLTALILGKLVIRAGRPNILLPVIGAIAYFCIQQTLLTVGLNLKYFNSFQALCIFSALVLFQRKKKTSIDHLGV